MRYCTLIVLRYVFLNNVQYGHSKFFALQPIQGWPCPFASSPLAIVNSTWLRKSASDEFSGEDKTNCHIALPLECRENTTKR